MSSDDGGASVASTQYHGQKKDIVHRVIDKLSTYMQKDENKRWLEIFIIDPVLNHILDRIFPYIIIMSIVFIVMIIIIVLTFLIVFTRIGNAKDLV